MPTAKQIAKGLTSAGDMQLGDIMALHGDKKINTLKEKAKCKLYSYNALVNQRDGSCGANLLAYISSEVATAAREFNEVMDELEKIDRTCPRTRLPEGK